MFSAHVSITMPFISSTNKTRRGRMTTRRNMRSVGGRVSIKTNTTGRVSVAKPMVSAVRTIAKSVVKKESETKLVGRAVVDADFTSDISSTVECYPIVPIVQQGDDDFNRTGDRIRPQWITVRGKIMLSREFASQQWCPPLTARVIIVEQRDLKTNTLIPTRADFGHLLKDNINIGSARPYSGGNFDNLAPINRDKFKVIMDRKFRFAWDLQTNLANSQGSGTNKAYYFTVRVKCPKTMYFDDVNGANPTNFAPFLCVGCVPDDNSGPFTVATPLRVTAQSILYFKDA